MEATNQLDAASRRCDDVCNGRSRWYVNLACAPFVLTFRSSAIYLWPCTEIIATRCLSSLVRSLCQPCFHCACCTYTDTSFPADDSSLGSFAAPHIVWRRSSELSFAHGKGIALVRDGIRPSDVGQGSLGDCWLLAAAACLAEFPGLLRNLFLQKEVSMRGKYGVRLWDVIKKRWTVIIVDDFFPCDHHKGTPVFAQPAEGELWVLLLEKAFAKYCGSYEKLHGGLTLWALHVMTGDHCFCLMRTSRSKWSRLNLVLLGSPSDPRKCGLRSTSEEYTQDELWLLLLAYDRGDAVLGASISSSTGEAQRADGLVAGHAYAVLQCRELFGIRLMQLRNPWGSFEWRGDWSDHSRLWDKHPQIQTALWPDRATHRQEGSDEGSFWISFRDFCSLFDQLDVCDRSTGARDLALRFDEDDGCIRGPACACMTGCARFWCLCQGCRALYMGHQTSSKTRDLPQRRCRCLECINGGEPVLL